MPHRRFGATGIRVSEVSFGAWAIGGKAYGAVDRQDSLRALARAEELGCNFVIPPGCMGTRSSCWDNSCVAAGAVGLSRRNIRSNRPG